MLVKKYIDDTTVLDRKKRDDRMSRLEALSEKLKGEILAKERSIQLMVEANNSIGGEGAQAKQARMQQELAKLDADVYATQREIQELESRISVLQKKV